MIYFRHRLAAAAATNCRWLAELVNADPGIVVGGASLRRAPPALVPLTVYPQSTPRPAGGGDLQPFAPFQQSD